MGRIDETNLSPHEPVFFFDDEGTAFLFEGNSVPEQHWEPCDAFDDQVISIEFERLTKKEEFPKLSGKNLSDFVQEQSEKRKIKIDRNTFNALIESSGEPFDIINNLEKLSLLNREKISVSDLELCGISKDYEFFYLVKTLSEENLAKKLSAIFILKSQNEDPAKIFNILSCQPHLSRKSLSSFDKDIKSGRLEYEEVLLSLAIS